MKLLFDELYSKEICAQLRALGHDVVGVKERPELIGLKDEQLFPLIVADGRAMVTENWAHFSRLVWQAAEEGLEHFGVIFTSAEQLPRGRGTIGSFVRVFDEFLRAHPAEDALLNGVRRLP